LEQRLLVTGVETATGQSIDEIDADIKVEIDVTHIPLVLHGASGIPENEVQAAKAASVNKFNADTDLCQVFRQGMLDVWSKGAFSLKTR
jgi:fructose-bisphosphate aldolase, class II